MNNNIIAIPIQIHPLNHSFQRKTVHLLFITQTYDLNK